MTKKLIVCLLIFLCLCTCLAPFNVIWADEPSVSIEISPSTAEVGQEIAVTLHFSGTTANISKVECNLTYNDTVVTALSDAGGRIVLLAENPTDSLTATCRFRILAEGTTTFSVEDCVIYDENGSIGSPSASATFSVSGTAKSSNANLAELKISQGTLEPGFSADITEYTVSVGSDVENITITAVPEDSSATTTFDNPALAVGQNKRIITVTAQDGTAKQYIITVVRATPEETGSSETSKPTATPAPTRRPTDPPQQTQIQWGTPAQDVTDAPDPSATAGSISQPPVTTAPPVATTPSNVMTVGDLKNAAMTVISIVAVIIVVILFTTIYCMQQKDQKKRGKGKRK